MLTEEVRKTIKEACKIGKAQSLNSENFSQMTQQLDKWIELEATNSNPSILNGIGARQRHMIRLCALILWQLIYTTTPYLKRVTTYLMRLIEQVLTESILFRNGKEYHNIFQSLTVRYGIE